jgi:hypothetical protein
MNGVELHWDEQRYFEESASMRMLTPSGSTLIVGTDFSSPARTLSRMIEARRRGLVVALYPMLTDPMEVLVEQVSAAIAQQPDEGQRRNQLFALRDNRLNVNEKPLVESAAYPADLLRAAILALKLSDVILCFTAKEKDRWAPFLGRAVRRFAYLPVPRVHESKKSFERGITVFAPQSLQTQLGFVALAAQERALPASFVSAEDRERAVTTRAVIVPSWWRPGRVVALSAAGHDVIAPANAAPDERCSCAVYGAVDSSSLGAAMDAVQSSSTSSALRFDPSPDAATADIENMRAPQTTGPRVSIIVRTHDRPLLLARALRSLVAQSHADLEIVVVNNGGADVAHLVESATGGRTHQYVSLREGVSVSAALNVGARAATGAYVGYLDDDDLLYPDHVARAVEALERSGADLAYTNCIAEYARVSDEQKTLLGFQVFRDSEFVAKDMYVDNVAPIHSIVHRSDVFSRFGYFDEMLPVLEDWEMWLRLSRSARFIHVDRITCEYSWRADPLKGNSTLKRQREFAESYEKITSTYAADISGLPDVVARQEQGKLAQHQRARQVAEAGPRIAELTIAAMAQNAVPVDTPVDPFA